MDENQEAPKNELVGVVKTKDKETIIAMHARGHNPVEIEYRYVPRYQMWYHFPETVELLEDMRKYSHGIELMVTVKDYENATDSFQKNLHSGQEVEVPEVTD